MTVPSQFALPPLPERLRSMLCTKCGYSNPETSATKNGPCENSNCQYFAFVAERDYTADQMRAYALAALAAQPQSEPSSATVPSDERASFEVWMKSCEGYPFAGKFATLMWKAWQARAVLAIAAPAVQEPEPTRDPNELESDFEWRLNAWHKSRRPAAQSADAVDAKRWREHRAKLDDLVTYCPTCCQGFAALPDMTHDQLIFECGKAAGKGQAKRDADAAISQSAEAAKEAT
jgi:hypothetical protein